MLDAHFQRWASNAIQINSPLLKAYIIQNMKYTRHLAFLCTESLGLMGIISDFDRSDFPKRINHQRVDDRI